ncbi:hypothetical protein [Tateyamaria sp. Alg231-49]|nr:hypothetical protein [Tateyamaria sp. Alg231-49]
MLIAALILNIAVLAPVIRPLSTGSLGMDAAIDPDTEAWCI